MRVLDLGSSTSYRERVAVWLDGNGIASDGILTITTRAGNRTTTVTYAVDYAKDRPYLLAHLRPLRDENSSEDGGPYWVECRGGKWSCNCRGFKTGIQSCKHADSVCLLQKDNKQTV